MHLIDMFVQAIHAYEVNEALDVVVDDVQRKFIDIRDPKRVAQFGAFYSSEDSFRMSLTQPDEVPTDPMKEYHYSVGKSLGEMKQRENDGLGAQVLALVQWVWLAQPDTNGAIRQIKPKHPGSKEAIVVSIFGGDGQVAQAVLYISRDESGTATLVPAQKFYCDASGKRENPVKTIIPAFVAGFLEANNKKAPITTEGGGKNEG